MKNKNYSYLAPAFVPIARREGTKERYNGEVTEWFKERAWKVRMPQKGIGGSNPPLSAQIFLREKNNEITKLKTTQ